MMVIPAYLYDDHEMHDVVLLGEVLAIAAIAVCLMFVTVDLGRPDRFWHLIPGIGRFALQADALMQALSTFDIGVIPDPKNGYNASGASKYSEDFRKRYYAAQSKVMNEQIAKVQALAARIKAGQHLKFAEATPMANLLVNVLHAVDIPQDSIGDSTGPLAGV